MHVKKFLEENLQYLVVPGIAIAALIAYVFFYFKTSAMLPEFERFIKATAPPQSELIDISSGNGFSAGTMADYRVSNGVKNEDIYNHYCQLMDKSDEWIEAEEIREDPYLLRSSCISPWKNKSKDIFSFAFCNKNGSVFDVVWKRDKHTPYPASQKVLITMGWRPDGPLDIGCKEWDRLN